MTDLMDATYDYLDAIRQKDQGLSVEQQHAVDTFEPGSGNSILLQACAGSGKTHTLLHLIRKIPGDQTLVLAFNKSIQQELEKKLPPHAKAFTLNALGHKVISRGLGSGQAGGTRLNLDTRKYFILAKKLFPSETFEAFSELAQITRVLRTKGYRPDQLTEDQIETATNEAGVVNEYHPSQVRRLMDYGWEECIRGSIDFDDQLWFSTLNFPDFFQKFHYVVIDEAQDLSPLQHRMVGLSLASGGQLIVAGDTNQAIYGFRGALGRSIKQLSQNHDLTECPLTQSFRVPEAICAEVRARFPWIKIHSEIQGTITKESVANGKAFELLLLEPTTTRVVLCRYNAPLFQLAFQRIARGLTVEFLAKDILGQFRPIIKALDKSSGPLLARLLNWQQTLLPSKRKYFDDKIECLEAAIGMLPSGAGTGELIGLLTELTNARSSFKLSTIHTAKGLEWPEVVLYRTDRMQTNDDPEDTSQENNIAYVGMTRAQKHLYLISDVNAQLFKKE